MIIAINATELAEIVAVTLRADRPVREAPPAQPAPQARLPALQVLQVRLGQQARKERKVPSDRKVLSVYKE